jgi:Winged helix DNA-binding domain
MTPLDIARLRLANQQITVHTSQTPQQVVGTLGGTQAQDYQSALWAIGLRLLDATRPQVEQALTNASIVRTWAMRGTLHFVASADVRWIIALLAPRLIAASAYRRRQLEIDDVVLARSRDVLASALSHGRHLTREEATGLLRAAGVQTAAGRGIHILHHLSLEGLLCQTAVKGTQATFALLDEWVPESETMSPDAALAELAYRYFDSHGPATLRDFGWWAGLTVADARAGAELAKPRLACVTVGDAVYWLSRKAPGRQPLASVVNVLPGFDEYVLGYADRGIALDAATFQRIVPGGNGVFRPTIVVDGRVVGTWRPGSRTRATTITDLFFALDETVSDAVGVALRDYDRFATVPAASA